MRAYAYRVGHYLLPHSDHQEGLGRALAYAYYLPSPEPPEGGELELFRCRMEHGELVSTLSHLHNGAIVLMHDGGGDRTQTVAAVARLTPELQRRGYRLVTIPELLDIPGTSGAPACQGNRSRCCAARLR